jgi:hypothetical protein
MEDTKCSLIDTCIESVLFAFRNSIELLKCGSCDKSQLWDVNDVNVGSSCTRYKIFTMNVIMWAFPVVLYLSSSAVLKRLWDILLILDIKDCDRLCGLVVRVPGCRAEMYCVSCEVRTEFIYVKWKKVDRLCGLVVRVSGYWTEMYCVSCEVRTAFICYVEESKGCCGRSGEVGRSVVYNRYNNGPRTLPWGTPALTDYSSVHSVSTFTRKCLLCE